MPEKYVKNGDLARIAFGQSIAVTPLQLISSFSAVVNGGFLYQPTLVKGIQASDGTYIEENEPAVVSQPISEATSQTMREILESVVSEGSGKNCYIPGYRVGGKTGTAQKYDDNGNPMTDKHIASFIGFAPADDPKIAVLIIVDEPDVAVDFGSVVAAPYVKSVLLNSLQYMGVEPDYDEVEELAQVEVPDLGGMDQTEAVIALKDAGLAFLADGTGQVTRQLPAPGTLVDEGTSVLLYTQNKTEADDMEGMTIVPDVMGKSVMEAAQLLEDNNLKMTIEGESGVATYQSPAADQVVPADTEVRVEFAASGE